MSVWRKRFVKLSIFIAIAGVSFIVARPFVKPWLRRQSIVRALAQDKANATPLHLEPAAIPSSPSPVKQPVVADAIVEQTKTGASLADLYEKFSPYCVRIQCQLNGKNCFGSGFFVSDEGHILCAMPNGSQYVVEIMGYNMVSAEKIGEDPVSSIALLKVDLAQKLPFFALLRAQEPVRIGQKIISLSCKFGQMIAPQKGMVTCFSDRCFDAEFPITFVRSSLPLDAGDCGGAVLDRQGNLVGMLLHALPDARESFYIPLWALRRIYQDLLVQRHVDYGYVGLNVELCWDNAQQCVCIRVIEVANDSPGQRYGFKVGDILWELDGVRLQTIEDLKNLIFQCHALQTVNFTVLRDGKKLQIPLRMVKRK